MKKIVLFLLCLLVASNCFAADLAGVLESASLSNDVTGFYFTDAAEQTYVLQTGHSSGNRIFASGSFATTISYIDTDATVTAVVATGFDSAVFDSGNTAGWTPFGD